MKKIIIVVPIYNMENYLPRFLDSVKVQTLNDINIICVNDGSSDKSPKILEDYAKLNKQFIIINSNNFGYSAAVNKGIEIALSMNGEYLGFLDPDDFIDNVYFERLYKRAKEVNADIAATSNISFVNENGEFIGNKKISGGSIDIDLKEKLRTAKYAGAIWNKIYRMDLIRNNDIRLPNFNDGWNDNYFTIKTLFYANKIAWIDNVIYSYTQRSDSLSKNKIKQNDSVINFWKWFENDLYSWKNVDKSTLLNLANEISHRKLSTIYIAYQRIKKEDQNEFLNSVQKSFPDLNINVIKKKLNKRRIFYKEKDIYGNYSYYIFGIKIFTLNLNKNYS